MRCPQIVPIVIWGAFFKSLVGRRTEYVLAFCGTTLSFFWIDVSAKGRPANRRIGAGHFLLPCTLLKGLSDFSSNRRRDFQTALTIFAFIVMPRITCLAAISKACRARLVAERKKSASGRSPSVAVGAHICWHSSSNSSREAVAAIRRTGLQGHILDALRAEIESQKVHQMLAGELFAIECRIFKNRPVTRSCATPRVTHGNLTVCATASSASAACDAAE